MMWRIIYPTQFSLGVNADLHTHTQVIKLLPTEPVLSAVSYSEQTSGATFKLSFWSALLNIPTPRPPIRPYLVNRILCNPCVALFTLFLLLSYRSFQPTTTLSPFVPLQAANAPLTSTPFALFSCSTPPR